MYCTKCGTDYDGNFCPNCGSANTPINEHNQPLQDISVPSATEPLEKQQKLNGKGEHNLRLIIIIILIIVLFVGGVFAFFALKNHFDPSKKVTDALKNGNYNEAVLLYEDLEEPSDNLIKSLKEHIDTIYINYKNNIIDYDTARLELDTIGKMDIVDEIYKYTEISSKIDDLNNSRTAFDTAKVFEENGDYVNAIAQYKLVIEDDSNYESAKESIISAMDLYKQSILMDSSEAVAKKDYETALSILNDSLVTLINDSEIKKQITVYTVAFETETLKKAENLIKAKKFDEAESMLNDALGISPDNSKLTEKLNSISSLRPVELKSVVVIDSSNFEYMNELFIDSFGNNYEGWYKFDPCYYNPYVIYNLNKNYSRLNCSLVANKITGSDRVFSFSIYADGKLIYSVTDYTKTTGKKNISLDVSNVTKLEFRASANGYSYSYLGIVDATLSK